MSQDLSTPIRANLCYVELQEYLADLLDLIDEEILDHEQHEPRLGQIASKTYLLARKVKHYRDLTEQPFDGCDS